MQTQKKHRLTIGFKQSRVVTTLLLILTILISTTIVSPYLSNPAHHQNTLATINESKNNATTLSLTVTLASTAITMLPDDYGSAIADELSELSTPPPNHRLCFVF